MNFFFLLYYPLIFFKFLSPRTSWRTNYEIIHTNLYEPLFPKQKIAAPRTPYPISWITLESRKNDFQFLTADIYIQQKLPRDWLTRNVFENAIRGKKATGKYHCYKHDESTAILHAPFSRNEPNAIESGVSIEKNSIIILLSVLSPY